MMRKFFLLLAFLPLTAVSQDFPLTGVTAKYVRPKYYEAGVGINISTFRDFATSPLVYLGGTGQFVLGVLRKDERIESSFSLRVSSGTYDTTVDPVEKTPSIVRSIFINYSRMYRLKNWSPGKWNFKVGGAVDIASNVRQNPSLLNAGVGLESFQTLFVSGKISRDISRKEEKRKKFLFLHYIKKPVKRELSFQLSPSLINNTFRNGYAYLGQSAITGDGKLFDNYKYSTFSGFRIKTALEYTRYLKNGNGIKYSYLWDAYKTGGSLPKFEMSHHILQLAFLFRVK